MTTVTKKAIIVTRHVGRRHPTTNQRNIKILDLMMKMVFIVPHYHHYHQMDEFSKHPKRNH